MRFTKMQGTGNDYVYVDCFRMAGTEACPTDPAALANLAQKVSDRHFGIGSDGLILICPASSPGQADARMQMFNADGSESEMCGNGIRCVAKYVYDHGIAQRPTMRIETGAGIKTVDMEVADGVAKRIRVDMSEPILDAPLIPTTLPGNPVMNAALEVGGQKLVVTCVSMGNPHCVTFVDELSDAWVLGIGPKIEIDPHFPRRVNAEFVEVISPTEVRMRVWERGSGETLACGTGACAVCVAGVLTGRTERKVLVHLLGGDLELEWGDDNHVYMTGPAVEVFSGEWNEAS